MSSNPKRILIVDNRLDLRQILRVFLSEMWPLEVAIEEAINGLQALLLTQQWYPHLILMDLRMPLMDGYEAIRQIRTLEQLQAARANSGQSTSNRLPIVAVAAAISQADRACAFAAGCDELIEKPFNLRQLYYTLSKFLELPIASLR